MNKNKATGLVRSLVTDFEETNRGRLTESQIGQLSDLRNSLAGIVEQIYSESAYDALNDDQL